MGELEKAIWTDDDFERLGWHDATVHGIGFVEGAKPWLGQLMLDIDYIVEWIAPKPPSTALAFEVAPATLVFDEAVGINMEMAAEAVRFGVALQILRLHRSPARIAPLAATHHDYRFEGSDFQLTLTAARFRLYFRSRPSPSTRQVLSAAERGLPSFAIDTWVTLERRFSLLGLHAIRRCICTTSNRASIRSRHAAA